MDLQQWIVFVQFASDLPVKCINCCVILSKYATDLYPMAGPCKHALVQADISCLRQITHTDSVMGNTTPIDPCALETIPVWHTSLGIRRIKNARDATRCWPGLGFTKATQTRWQSLIYHAGDATQLTGGLARYWVKSRTRSIPWISHNNWIRHNSANTIYRTVSLYRQKWMWIV